MDITKCSGIDCPFKDQCYRHTAPDSYLQSYFADPPIKGDKCDFYWGKNAEFVWNQVKDNVNEKS
jgi:hypothetical protein